MMRRPALRYHGGKWNLAPKIIECFPEHDCYVESFGGGANVLLRKPAAFIDVYNDLGGLVVNFFRVLRERPVEFMRAIELTPYSRQEFKESQIPCDDPLEQARRFYVWSWQGRGRAGVTEPGGWRFMSRKTRGQTPVDDWKNNEHLRYVVERLRDVHIENDNAVTVIGRFDGEKTLHYVDPPYVHSTRGERWRTSAYTHEYTDEQHRHLSDVLHSAAGAVVLSGYRCDLYDNLYADWRRIDLSGQKDNSHTRTSIECLWISRDTAQGRMFL